MRARKRFGQHFLTDTSVLEAIRVAMGLEADDRLLEIGPGRGALTEYLYGLTNTFVAVEIDRDLVGPLAQRFPQLQLVSGDILRVDLEPLLGAAGDWRVCGNLPYNVSTPLLLRLLSQTAHIRDMHFMLQAEVAARLAAVPGSKTWGRLSVMVSYHCEVERLLDVPPEAFEPPPAVDSAVVRLVPRPPRTPAQDSALFALTVRLAFSQRRKRLANALKSLPVRWDRVSVSGDIRADDVSVEDFVELANDLCEQGVDHRGHA